MTVKRVYDIFWSVLGLLAFASLFAVIAVLIKLEDGGPVFFHQERVGYKGKPLIIRKFRTMVRDADKRGIQLTVSRDSCITRVGCWLRKTKLDELPQLMNVLLGEMTLVGPRPEVPRYVALYTNEQRRVFELVPGITDPASIKYCNEGEILACLPDPELLYIKEILPEKIRLTLSYAERATVLSDTWVIINTILNIAFRYNQESKRMNPGA
jgi:lipopolysaccharide/colanic/teichoic acid biosynthesis glycosyltransferase